MIDVRIHHRKTDGSLSALRQGLIAFRLGLGALVLTAGILVGGPASAGTFTGDAVVTISNATAEAASDGVAVVITSPDAPGDGIVEALAPAPTLVIQQAPNLGNGPGFNIGGVPYQSVDINIPDFAYDGGNGVLGVGGLTHTGGANPTIGGDGSSTFGLNLTSATVTTAAELGFFSTQSGADGPALTGAGAVLAESPTGETLSGESEFIGLAEQAVLADDGAATGGDAFAVPDTTPSDQPALADGAEALAGEGVVEGAEALADPAAGEGGEAIADSEAVAGAETDGTQVASAPLPINQSNPFGIVTNVGPYFYVMISYY